MPPAPSIDTGKILEMRFVQGLTYAQISSLTGLAESTICERVKRLETILPDQAEINLFRHRRADVLSGLQAGLVARIAECLQDNKDNISAYQATGMFGILYDKERLETGKSTSNISALTRIVESAQDSGDEALRKQVIEVNRPKITSQND